MPDKDKLYPPPQIEMVNLAYDSVYGKFTGEATLCMGAFYIAGGVMAIILGCFIWGVAFRAVGDGIRVKDPLSVIAYIAIALASFQWVTRGYFPQAVDHAVYLSIPIWIMRIRSKKIHAGN
jgi:TRAP-type C4-dicarboxylate transport system permease small subunit